MLENLNSRVFTEQLHTTFEMQPAGVSPLALELIEVAEKESSPNVEQFFLIFRGPLGPHFPQGTYTLKHEKLGNADLFVVPLGPDAEGMRYQVVFNRLRQTKR